MRGDPAVENSVRELGFFPGLGDDCYDLEPLGLVRKRLGAG